MAVATYTVDQRVRVTDDSSAYRNMPGTVVAVLDDDTYAVRLDGHSCNSRVNFLVAQLKTNDVAARVSYAQCAG